MAIRRRVELASLGTALRRDLQVVIHASDRRTVEALVTDFYVIGPRATPVGTLGRPKPGGRAGDPGHGTTQHPGYLRSTLWTSVGRAVFRRPAPTVFNPLPSLDDALGQLRRRRAGAPAFLTYGARYGASIEAGLRTVNGQRYGSPQAPKGWVRPSLERVVAAHRGGTRIKALVAKDVRAGGPA